jgi:predicted O-methyltransferase YrrM
MDDSQQIDGKPPGVKRQSITVPVSALNDADKALHQVLVRLFGRTPTDMEMTKWTERLRGGMSGPAFINQVSRSKAFLARPQVGSKAPPGHFYSPVVDPDAVRGYVEQSRAAGLSGLHGIDFPLEAMAAFWDAHATFIAAAPFPETPDGTHRYCYEGGPYPPGDAIVLRTMIAHWQPKRIIEIGSGYSTACMLDTADELGRDDLSITCIEPYPERLFSRLKPEDQTRLTLHRHGVQDVPIEAFRALERNDILFIDSSHVLKTGSDVHYELFHILPNLAPGVIVHFHDCRFPMEYSDRQIFVKNYSWNEVYGVRAMLMYSTRFEVIFYGSLFAERFPERMAQSAPFRSNPGSALWIRVRES